VAASADLLHLLQRKSVPMALFSPNSSQEITEIQNKNDHDRPRSFLFCVITSITLNPLHNLKEKYNHMAGAKQLHFINLQGMCQDLIWENITQGARIT